jgi:hypothetical protein
MLRNQNRTTDRRELVVSRAAAVAQVAHPGVPSAVVVFPAAVVDAGHTHCAFDGSHLADAEPPP